MKYKKSSSTTISSKHMNSAIYLLIVESPSKCHKIEQFLGPQYACIASMGHLRRITGMKSINTKDKFQPSYEIITTKEKHIMEMKTIIKKFNKNRIFIATDDDREGEAIAWHLCELFDFDTANISRIKFHEITQKAIVNAVNAPGKINMDLVNSAIARQVLDVIVGFKISPLLWTYLYNNRENPLSAGRCQTPALRLIHENELIDRSSQSISYRIKGDFTSQKIPFVLNSMFDDTSEIEKFLQLNIGFDHKLSLGNSGKRTEKPPLPFNTSNLLQYVCTTMNTSTQQVMKMCQELYQSGHITYMRTDSKTYSKEFVANCHKFISSKYGDKYLNTQTSLSHSNINNPHEAIRVTNIHISTISDTKNPRLNTLYRIIWKNTIESCMAPATYSTQQFNISAPEEKSFGYKDEVPVFLGWRVLVRNTEDKKPLSFGEYLKSLTNTVPIPYKKLYNECSYKSGTPYYNESSLVKTLEKLGIGRPSTFASIIQTLVDRKYVENTDIEGIEFKCDILTLQCGTNTVERKQQTEVFGGEKNKLRITNIGLMAIKFLCENFDDFFSYGYTERMEQNLDKISSSEIEEWYLICKECYDDIKSHSKQIKHVSKHGFQIDETHTFCFEKYGPIIIKKDGDNIEYLKVRNDIPIDIKTLNEQKYTLDELVLSAENSIGTYNDEPIFIRNGKFGHYLECGNIRETVKNIKDPSKITLSIALDILQNRSNTGILRELSNNLSIRKGKFGPYVFYKTPTMPKPSFFNIKKFPVGFMTCSQEDIIKWLEKTYDIQLE